VTDTAALLSLTNVTGVTARAEEYAKPPVRESFDCVTARAVANLRALSELCIPFVRVGGRFLSMKATGAREELDDARRAIGSLGAKVEKIEDFTLSDGAEELSRTAILIRKTKPTDAAYPRAWAKILKKPL
jgi:16S rRNA (guanine527-N7)-methyltransferase